MNLGELYITLSIDTSAIDDLSEALKRAADVATQVGQQIEDALSTSTSNGARQATDSTVDFASAIGDAVTKGELLANAYERAFDTIIGAAKKAAETITDFVGSAVESFGSVQQSMQSVQAIFGDKAADEIAKQAQNALGDFNMSAEKYLEIATKYGNVIIQDIAQKRAKNERGDVESYEDAKARLSNYLEDVRAVLNAEVSDKQQANSLAVASKRDEYAKELEALKDYYAEEEAKKKDELDREYQQEREVRQKALADYRNDRQDEYDALKDELDDAVDAARRANDAAVTDLRRSLEDSYNSLKQTLDDAVDAMVEANKRAYEDRKSELDKAYRDLKAELDSEVSAYKEATDARVKEMQREKKSRLSDLADERDAAIAAVDSEVDSYEEAATAASEIAKQREYTYQIESLLSKANSGKTYAERLQAAQQAAALINKQREEQQAKELAERKKAASEEKERIKAEYADRKETLTQQLDDEIDVYKTGRAKHLEEMRNANSERLAVERENNQRILSELKDRQAREVDAEREKNAATLLEAKRANEDELTELKNANADQIRQMQEDNEAKLKEKQRSNQQLILDMQQANANELREIKDNLDGEFREYKASNETVIAARKEWQNQQLTDLKTSLGNELEALRESNRLRLQEMKDEVEREKALAKSNDSIGYVKPIEQDQLDAAERLKEMAGAISDIMMKYDVDESLIWRTMDSILTGNYRMFDELKTGFGGTKTEFQTFVSEMSKLMQEDYPEAMELDPDSFADFIKALDTYVNEVGIANTATEEAKDTTEGATLKLGNAWQNLITAIGTYSDGAEKASKEGQDKAFKIDVDTAVTNFSDSLDRYVYLITPVIVDVIEAIIKIVVPEIEKHVPEIWETFKTALIESAPEDWKEDLTSITTGIETFFTELKKIFDENGGADGVFQKVLTTVDDFLTTLNNVTTVLEPLIPLFESLVGVIVSLSPVLIPLGTAFGVFSTAKTLIGGAKGAGDLFSKILGKIAGKESGGIGGVSDAAAGAAEVISDAGTKFTVFEGGATGAATATESLSGFLGPLVGPAGLIIAVGAAILYIVGTNDKLMESITNFVGTGDKAVTDSSVQTASISSDWDKMAQSMKTSAQDASDAITITTANGYTDIYSNMKDTRKAVEDETEGAKKSGTKNIEDLYKAMKDTADESPTLKDKMSGSIDGIKEAVDEKKQSVIDKCAELFKEATHQFGGDKPEESLKGTGRSTIEGFVTGSYEIWQEKKNVFNDIVKSTVGTFNDGLEVNSPSKVLDKIGRYAIEGFGEGASAEWDERKKFFSDLQNVIKGFFDKAGDWLKDSGNAVMRGFHDAVSDGWSGVSKFMSDIGSSVTRIFDGAENWLVNAGINIMNGLLQGLSDAWSGVTDFVGGIGDWIQENKGPEEYDKKLLVPAGRWIIGGLAEGMRDSFGQVRDAVDDVTSMLSVEPIGINVNANATSRTKQRPPINIYMTYNAGEDATQLVNDMTRQLRLYGYSMGGTRYIA